MYLDSVVGDEMSDVFRKEKVSTYLHDLVAQPSPWLLG